MMVNEAARCVEEKVAIGGVEDIDFAMVMGTGFAPFRGGPLRYADTVGASEFVGKLPGDQSNCEPCALLRDMASSGRKFYEAV